MINPTVLSETLSIAPFNDSLVTVTLRSINHRTNGTGPVSNTFNINFIVNDGNEMLQFNEVLNLPVGGTHRPQGITHHFEYQNTNCEELLEQGMTFFVHVVTDNLSKCKDEHVLGKLVPGRSTFILPVELTSGERVSKLIFRGTIHVSCPNDGTPPIGGFTGEF